MARAIWKGVIRFEDEEVPVKLYAAVEDRSVHFRLLNERTKNPVKQRMVHPETGAEVPYDEVRRGYQTEDGRIVLLDEEELAALEPEAARGIQITRFVPPEKINHQWYDRPYYLGPDGAEGAYTALARALERQGREGVARWTMRKKEYRGALRAEDGHLLLITLRSADEVVAAAELPRPEGRKLDARELKMARQLISALEDAWEPAAWQDEYRERVMELVEAKASGKTVKFRKPKARREEKSLEEALKKSVAAARKGKAA